jgi:hypothetical protein
MLALPACAAAPLSPAAPEVAEPSSPTAAIPVPAWIPDLLGTTVGDAGASAARARLFSTGTDAEVFAGLVAFSEARDVALRRVAAWHLSGASPFSGACGVPIDDALDALRRDEDAEVRRLAGRGIPDFHEGCAATEIVSGDVRVGVEQPIPYPGLDGVRVHVLVRGIAWGTMPWDASLDYKAEARTEGGGVMGGTGGQHRPDMTESCALCMATTSAQYGFCLWFRVIDEGTVRYWLRGLRKPA